MSVTVFHSFIIFIRYLFNGPSRFSLVVDFWIFINRNKSKMTKGIRMLTSVATWRPF